MDTVIEIAGLTKVYKDFWRRDKIRAVDDATMSVHSGEVFGLLGPNGSGKTTIIKLILGLLFPTRGMVRVFGLSPRDVLSKKRIGFLPEESYLYKYLNAHETMDFYGRLFELSSLERSSRGKELLSMLGLASASTRPIGEYSKGMAKRIGIAQALINDPELIIFDEPTSGLDPIGRRQIKNLVLELKSKGKTVFLSSHLLGDVEDLCDRIAILGRGQIVAKGKVDELLVEENVMQISASGISEKTANEAVNILKRDGEGSKVELKKGRESLEQFFLSSISRFEHPEQEAEKSVKKQKDELSVIQRLQGKKEPKDSTNESADEHADEHKQKHVKTSEVLEKLTKEKKDGRS